MRSDVAEEGARQRKRLACYATRRCRVVGEAGRVPRKDVGSAAVAAWTIRSDGVRRRNAIEDEETYLACDTPLPPPPLSPLSRVGIEAAMSNRKDPRRPGQAVAHRRFWDALSAAMRGWRRTRLLGPSLSVSASASLSESASSLASRGRRVG